MGNGVTKMGVGEEQQPTLFAIADRDRKNESPSDLDHLCYYYCYHHQMGYGNPYPPPVYYLCAPGTAIDRH